MWIFWIFWISKGFAIIWIIGLTIVALIPIILKCTIFLMTTIIHIICKETGSALCLDPCYKIIRIMDDMEDVVIIRHHCKRRSKWQDKHKMVWMWHMCYAYNANILNNQHIIRIIDNNPNSGVPP